MCLFILALRYCTRGIYNINLGALWGVARLFLFSVLCLYINLLNTSCQTMKLLMGLISARMLPSTAWGCSKSAKRWRTEFHVKHFHIFQLSALQSHTYTLTPWPPCLLYLGWFKPSTHIAASMSLSSAKTWWWASHFILTFQRWRL